MSRPWDDERWWYGREPDPWGREDAYLRDLTPGATDRPRIGIPTATDIEAAEEVIREMGWGESSAEEDGEA